MVQGSVFRKPGIHQVRRLLLAAGLPTEDLEEADLSHFFGLGAPDDPAGVVGLEPLGSSALLRSLVVATAARGTGAGRALVEEAEREAERLGVRVIYLLTTTAAGFFERVGYRPVGREAAPPAIRGTREFGELCPASATFMAKHLDPTGRS